METTTKITAGVLVGAVLVGGVASFSNESVARETYEKVGDTSIAITKDITETYDISVLKAELEVINENITKENTRFTKLTDNHNAIIDRLTTEKTEVERYISEAQKLGVE